ncbi:MAG TPA: tail fiber domain-containing protein [Thermoanaerobaculia bacterium]|nr:tail fiber domain-containing protein [Thermoanaerobaculia bacterium]
MPKRLILGIFAAGICVVAAGAASGVAPQQVSPAGLVEARCPTFSWSAVSGAAGYELLVYEVLPAGDVGREPLLSVRLPGGAASWTPPGASCLAAGGRYAWTLRVLGREAEGGWAESVLFEVAAAPSLGEVEAALATLRRYLGGEEGGRSPAAEAGTAEAAEGESARPGEAVAVAERLREAAASRAGGEGPRSVTAAAVPSLGSPSLTVDSNVALGAASNLFKAGSVFLWDDTEGNTALGRLALASATGTATNNTAFGREALRDTMAGVASVNGSNNTAVGDQALRSNTTGSRNTASGSDALYSNTTGFDNTASGDRALWSNTTGIRNTASGSDALYSNTTGSDNTATGQGALRANTTGDDNTASGRRALYSTTGSRNTAVGLYAGRHATTGGDNIFLGSGAQGSSSDTNTIRIGGSTGGGSEAQNRTFIAGIRGITTESVNTVPVVIDINGQLGTESSSREVKQDLREVGELSRRLLDLRPVAFRYKVHAAADPETPLQFGLIAEEVAEVFPELVVRDGDGRPETVKYHLLAALLLNELQREHDRIDDQERDHLAELAALRERVAALEASEPRPAPKRKRWWRRP